MLVSAAGAACIAAPALAGTPVVVDRDIIYTKIATSPTSVVPGALDLAGLPAATNFRALEDLIMSPDGSLWLLKARTQQGADSETILMMGSGLTGSAFAQEGRPIIGGASGELYDFFGSAIGSGRFNTLNQFAFSARARGGSAAVFQKVIRWTGGASFTVPFAMGSSISGLLDTGFSGDETFGNSLGSVHLLDNGTIGTQDSTIQNIATTRRPAIMYDQAAFHQSNVTSVTNLAGTGIEVWRSISANTFYSSADGTSYIAAGTVGTLSDAALVVNNRVVMQANQLIPGTTVTFTAVFNNDMKANGDWYARGDDPADNDWAVANGVLIAKTGDPIGPGAGENWGTTFSAFNINRNGDYVLVGDTNSANPAADNVVVVNGVVVLREGDPVDVNGDGLFNDDAFVGRGTNTLAAFEPNDWVLTDDLQLYGFITLRNGAGQDLNSTPAFGAPQAFMRIALATPPVCPGDFTGDNQIDTADLVILLGFFGQTVPVFTNGDMDGNGTVDTADLVLFLSVFASPCT
ncbi:MAG: hypothetical protein ACKVZJ_10075 [Phycisphaerales bacterium]